MEDLKTIKEITYFVLTVMLVIGIILVTFRWKDSLEKRSELYKKESELIDLKKENQKKESRLYDLAIEEKEGK